MAAIYYRWFWGGFFQFCDFIGNNRFCSVNIYSIEIQCKIWAIHQKGRWRTLILDPDRQPFLETIILNDLIAAWNSATSHPLAVSNENVKTSTAEYTIHDRESNTNQQW